MDVIPIGEDERTRYDDAVASSPMADIMQSYEWGEVKAPTGWDALRLLAVDGDVVRGACSVLRKVPAPGVPPLLYAPRGPVVDPGDTEALRAVLDAIRARAGDAFLFKCDPPIEVGSAEADAFIAAGMRSVSSGPFGGVQPRAIMELDLSPGEGKIFEGFKSKWRYNVRLAERRGVTIREGSAADLDAFHALYRETAARDGFTGWGPGYFRTLTDVLGSRDMMTMFMAEHEGDLLAAIIVMTFGERAVYVFGASSNAKRNLMPNHLIQWHAIRWAIRRGLRVYDFRGVSPVRDGEPVEEHIAGLNRFKAGFGATYVEYAGEFDLPLRRGWYGLWRTGMPLAMKVRSRLRGGTPGD